MAEPLAARMFPPAISSTHMQMQDNPSPGDRQPRHPLLMELILCLAITICCYLHQFSFCDVFGHIGEVFEVPVHNNPWRFSCRTVYSNVTEGSSNLFSFSYGT